MQIYSEKGYTGVDIAISIIVIFIFVSLIATLIYRFNSSSKEIELKSEATYLAIGEIEKIKNNGFETYDNLEQNATQDNEGNYLVNQPTDKEGFFKTITIMDYTEIPGREQKVQNLVKKVTVKISYTFQAKEQIVEFSTILSKENGS